MGFFFAISLLSGLDSQPAIYQFEGFTNRKCSLIAALLIILIIE
jgi:hypothetical protein